jgi:hypothetical protein
MPSSPGSGTSSLTGGTAGHETRWGGRPGNCATLSPFDACKLSAYCGTWCSGGAALRMSCCGTTIPAASLGWRQVWQAANPHSFRPNPTPSAPTPLPPTLKTPERVTAHRLPHTKTGARGQHRELEVMAHGSRCASRPQHYACPLSSRLSFFVSAPVPGERLC